MSFFARRFFVFALALIAIAVSSNVTRAELVAHFPLDDDAVDPVGGFEGFVPDGVSFVDDGVHGGSAEFEGFEGISVEYDEQLNPEDAFTVTAWVNPTDTTDWNSVITSRSHEGDPQIVTGYIIYNTPDNDWDFWVGTGGPPGAWGRSLGPQAELDEWQHLAITYDAESDIKYLYINGEEEVVSEGQGYAFNTQNPLSIGAGDDVGNGFFYTGLIDDVGIWNEALDQATVQKIMSEGVASFLTAGADGDFNGDGVLDASDIDALTAEVRGGGMDASFDANGDGEVNRDDRDFWVSNLRKTWIGDANLDGEFNSSDFVAVFQAGEYEDNVADNSSWSTGDWNGDGEFDSSDFVSAFQSGGYEQGPLAANQVVPEPHGLLLALVGMFSLSTLLRRHR